MGLFLSKFDRRALGSFGFTGYKEAFNVLGYSVKTPPGSIKNYRDEFDPYFPNPRKGWHGREIRDYCKNILDEVGNLPFDQLYQMIKSFILDNYVSLNDIHVKDRIPRSNKFSANRLITGRAAEEYFVMNYQAIPVFQNYTLLDTTKMGCGFDYKLSLTTNNFYVEVKGINGLHGGLLMTEKEYNMAEDLLEKYCLFIVKNFKETPTHQMFFNPLHCGTLQFQRHEQQIPQITYSTNII